MDTLEQTVANKAVEEIDKFLADISGRELVSSDQVRDVLLDLRIILNVSN